MLIADSSSVTFLSCAALSEDIFSKYSRHIFWSYTRSRSFFLSSSIRLASCILTSSSEIISIIPPFYYWEPSREDCVYFLPLLSCQSRPSVCPPLLYIHCRFLLCNQLHQADCRRTQAA